MRRAIFTLLLLHAAAATAAVVISDEVVSAPISGRRLTLPFAAPAVSMAKDRTGVAIAWAMPDAASIARVYVARLDSAGHVAGAVREIAATVPEIDAVAPSIAVSPSGSGFTLAWMEISTAVYCQLDAALTPSAPVVLGRTETAPLVRSGSSSNNVWIAEGGLVWAIAPDGRREALAGISASDMAVGTDVPQLIGARSVKTFVSCTCGLPHLAGCPAECMVYDNSYAIDYVAIYTASQSRGFPFVSDAQPAIASNAHDLAMAWFEGPQATGGNLMAARVPLTALPQLLLTPPLTLGSFPPDSGATRPAIASDGERFIAVWRVQRLPGDHDIVGAVIETDGSVTPLTIAASAADERDPSIIALGRGAFLVAYEKVDGGERRIAGRFVTFGRARASR